MNWLRQFATKMAKHIVKKDRRAWSKKANQARNVKLSPQQRSDIARHAARVRHSRERKARKLAKIAGNAAADAPIAAAVATTVQQSHQSRSGAPNGPQSGAIGR